MRRLLIILLVVALAVGGVFFITQRKRESGNNETPVGQRTFRSIFNFASKTEETTPEASEGAGEEAFIDLPALSRYRQLTGSPVAGFTAYAVKRTVTVPAADPKQKPTTQTIVDRIIRYVGRANGYVYEIKNGDIPLQITNIFIPAVYEASFTTPDRALLRFLRDDNRTIATYSVPVPPLNPDGTRTQQQGTYFADDIRSLAVAPSGTLVAHLSSDADGSIISTSSPIAGGKKELLRSPFESWLLSWQGTSVYAQTKATAAAPGSFYRVDTINKRLVRVLTGIQGMTASISPNGTYVLYSESTGGSFSSSLLTVKTGQIRRLDVTVLPEKCVWLVNENLICAGNSSVPVATYPDDWYAGTVAFSDKLYRIVSAAGISDIIDDGDTFSYDATSLFADEEQTILYFIDKRTGLLWQFDY